MNRSLSLKTSSFTSRPLLTITSDEPTLKINEDYAREKRLDIDVDARRAVYLHYYSPDNPILSSERHPQTYTVHSRRTVSADTMVVILSRTASERTKPFRLVFDRCN